MAKDNLEKNQDQVSKLNEKNHQDAKNEFDSLNIRRILSPGQEKNPASDLSEPQEQNKPVTSNQTDHPEALIDQKSDFSENSDRKDHSKDTLELPFEKINIELQNTNSASNQSLHRSNRNLQNDQTIIRENSTAYNTETLKQYLHENDVKKRKDIKEQNLEQMQEDLKHGSKLYELIGYTTVGKVNYSLEKEKKQRFLKNTLITFLLIIIMILIILIKNPIKGGIDFKKILGIDSKYKYDDMEQTDSINHSEMTSANEFSENSN